MTSDELDSLKFSFTEAEQIISELKRERDDERMSKEVLRGRYIQALEHLQSCRSYGEALAQKVETLEKEIKDLARKIEGMEHPE
jgi:chromosome segregation ATPase